MVLLEQNIAPAPIFRPSWEEFRDFNGYLNSIQDQVKDIGLCKIIPPKEWNSQFNYDKVDFSQISIPNPIKQYVDGEKGAYQLTLMERPKMSIEKFKDMADKVIRILPSPFPIYCE